MLAPPGLPARLAGRLVERDRWEWRRADGGDPLAQVAEFLADAGLDVGDLTTSDRASGVAGAALLVGGGVGGSDARAAYDVASPCPEVPDVCAVVYAAAPETVRPRTGTAALGPWTPSWSPTAHAAAVEAVREAIGRGDVYQVNVVGHWSAPHTGDPLAAGPLLAAVPDARYAGSLAGDGWAVHTASPELVLRVRDGVVSTRPIKGTAARGANAGADVAARRSLRQSAKDRAEHVMIVDLERNDLARVARIGSVHVDELYAVRALAGVWHAESTVSAHLLPGTGLAALLDALLPGGSVTGAPKLAAIEHIARLEQVGRGPSMGALGWIGADGVIELALTIRTMAVAGHRAHLWAGGGVTWGSDPLAEVDEANAKVAPLFAALSRLQESAAHA